jgi:tetratricopeptide (TPR) repeat protein
MMMRWGLRTVLTGAVLAAAGCASHSGQLQVRAIADPASKLGTGSERIAEARGQLALGNVGLAIEAFRAALREQPDSVEAMRGLAACYDSMGRSDLSARYYQAALAVAPHDPASLNAFAGSMEAQGDHAQAAELRDEAVQANALSATAAPVRVASDNEAAPSVTIALPPPRPAAEPQVSLAALVPLQPVAPVVPLTIRTDGPRLQRLSPGEVALLTGSEPTWRPTIVARTARSTTVRWVALNTGPVVPNVRLLNAARSQGLAARTRGYLLARGWRGIDIGDANAVRASSLVLYPAGRQAAGRHLAAQFGARSAITQQGRQIVVLLGRDVVGRRAAQARG